MSATCMLPRPINHIALSVADLDAVVAWYNGMFGFQQIGPTNHYKRSETPDANIFRIYPSDLNEVKVALMTTGNGVGFEVFQFVDPAPVVPEKSFQYHVGGIFHICVTDPNPNSMASKVVAHGGRRIGEMVNVAENEAIYVEDPWGNVVEILSTSFERFVSNKLG